MNVDFLRTHFVLLPALSECRLQNGWGFSVIMLFAYLKGKLVL